MRVVRCHIRQHQIGAGQYAERAEVVLANPGGMGADRLDINRLVEDIDRKAISVALIFLVVVAQRKEADLIFPILASEGKSRKRAASVCRLRADPGLLPHEYGNGKIV